MSQSLPFASCCNEAWFGESRLKAVEAKDDMGAFVNAAWQSWELSNLGGFGRDLFGTVKVLVRYQLGRFLVGFLGFFGLHQGGYQCVFGPKVQLEMFLLLGQH